MISLTHLLLIGLGGGLGSIVRVLVSEITPVGRLPWGTMAANVAGSLIIGWVLARLGPPGESNGHWQAFLAFGFCGGFTTFSSFSWQTLEQLRRDALCRGFGFDMCWCDLAGLASSSRLRLKACDFSSGSSVHM